MVQLRRVVTCLDGRRIPLNSTERAEIPGNYPYWGANGIVDSVGKFLFDEELVLLGEDGAPFGEPLKDVAFRIAGPIWVNNHIHVLRPSKSTDPRFLTYALNSVDWPMYISGSTREKLTQDDMNRAQVPLPELDVQRAITDYLDVATARIAALIEKKRRMIELFRYRRQVVITSEVTVGALSPRVGGTSGGERPAEVPLRRLFSSVIGGAWGNEPDDAEIVLPCVRGTDFDYVHLRTNLSRAPLRGFSRSDVALRSARRGDLLIEKSGGGETQPVGRVALHNLDDVVMPTNFAGRLRTADHVDSRFASYLLASLYADGRTRAAIKQTTGIQNLDLDALLSFRVGCPSLELQKAIADYLDTETARVDGITERVETQIHLLYEHRQALITAAVTGELSVPRLEA